MVKPMVKPMVKLMVEKYKTYGFALESDEEIAASAREQILLEIQKTLGEMRRIAVFAAENQLTARQRDIAQARIDSLKKEVDGIASMLSAPGAALQ